MFAVGQRAPTTVPPPQPTQQPQQPIYSQVQQTREDPRWVTLSAGSKFAVSSQRGIRVGIINLAE